MVLAVRMMIWHGYLLGGTGSNVYTRALAREWSRAGHDVTVFCQDPHPERFDLGGARVVRPDIDGPLPVFVLDRYDAMTPQLLTEMSSTDRERFVEQNVDAIRAEAAEGGGADLLFVNHVLLGGPVGAASGLPFVVKAHGSELEFAMRGDDELCAWAADSLRGARAVLAGSDHIAAVLDELVAVDPAKVHVVPPGVDVEALAPEPRDVALAALVAECAADDDSPPDWPSSPGSPSQRGSNGADPRRPDEGNAARLAAFLAGDRPTVVYVGKLSEEKGVHLLIDALRGLDARCVVVGFGPARPALEVAAGDDLLFTGPLEHRHLAHLWPLADVSVTPSVFPEAFGMVAAEAAACGSPPLVARHSGLAEIAAALEAGYPPDRRHLVSFARGDVGDLGRKLAELIGLPSDAHDELSRAARAVALANWSWTSIAARVLSAAHLPD